MVPIWVTTSFFRGASGFNPGTLRVHVVPPLFCQCPNGYLHERRGSTNESASPSVSRRHPAEIGPPPKGRVRLWRGVLAGTVRVFHGTLFPSWSKARAIRLDCEASRIAPHRAPEARLKSVAVIGTHPVHPVLVPVRSGCSFSPSSEKSCTGIPDDRFWFDFSYTWMGIGIAFALVAAVAGAIDYVGVKMSGKAFRAGRARLPEIA